MAARHSHKKGISRRDFLKAAAAGLGAAALAPLLSGCESQTPAPSAAQQAATQGAATTLPAAGEMATASPAPTASSAQPGAAATAEPADTQGAAATTPAEPSASAYLVAARLDEAGGDGDAEKLVRQAIEALGGMSLFVPKNASVLIKPNICVAYHSYEYAATTNPWVVGALVKLCFEAGAKTVQVLDYPFGGTAKKAYAISGIEEQVKAAGGEMVVMPGFKFVKTKFPKGVSIKEWPVYEDALKADVLIDVPIAKDHGLARLTLGMKNLMGLIENRSSIHAEMGQRLADLATLFAPKLTVIDAMRMLMAGGPTGGNLNDVKLAKTIIASADIVAADSYGATLFGLQPDDLSYVRAGTAMGLGRSDLKNLVIKEINVAGG